MTTTPISAIELRVISCKDLRSFNFFQKLSVYTAVSIVTEEEENNKKLRIRHQLQKTPLDKEGDGNPEWNHDVRFNLKEVNNNSNILDIDSTFLEFHFIAHGVLFGEKKRGEVRVPFTDLVGEYNGAVRFISYQVKNPEGDPNGVLNFSYKLIEEEKMKKKANKIPRNGVLNFSYKLIEEEKMKKKANKIPRNGFYPEIEVDDVDNVLVSTSYPPSPPGNQILYPTTQAEVLYPPPPLEVLYPPPASEVCWWEPPPPLLYLPPPQPEVCCMEPPPFYFPPPPPRHHEVAFYPPLPHPIVQGVPPPPPPYGGYNYPMRSTVEYRHHSFDGDTWSR